MSPEDFTNGPIQNHPEVTSAPPEAIQPAEQVTLRHLICIMNNKVGEPSKYDGKRGADLHRQGEQTGAASIWTMEKGMLGDYPDCIGQVHRQERIGSNDDRVITNYFILDAPDGLQIEKHGQVANFGRERMLLPGDSPENGLILALEGLERVSKMRENKAIENELGLSFVSEHEVRELLAFIEPLEKF